MTTSNKPKFSMSEMLKTGRAYVDTRLKLFQLQATERISRLFASLLVDALKVIFALFVLFFLSLALGFYFSELFGSASLGFLTTGGIFILFILVLSMFEVRLERKLINLTIKRFLSKWEESEADEEENLKNQFQEASSAQDKADDLDKQMSNPTEPDTTANTQTIHEAERI